MKRLDDSSKKAVAHVNAFVAHAEAGAEPPVVTYEDFDIAIDTIDELVCKYSLLVDGSRPSTTLPTAQSDPLSIFRSGLWSVDEQR